MLRGDWGFSIVSRVNVDTLILQRLPVTLGVIGVSQVHRPDRQYLCLHRLLAPDVLRGHRVHPCVQHSLQLAVVKPNVRSRHILARKRTGRKPPVQVIRRRELSRRVVTAGERPLSGYRRRALNVFGGRDPAVQRLRAIEHMPIAECAGEYLDQHRGLRALPPTVIMGQRLWHGGPGQSNTIASQLCWSPLRYKTCPQTFPPTTRLHPQKRS
jgi:hypothetical protein